MSWSLAISNGDLSYGPNGLNTVTGSAKLIQDLSCWLLEPLGTDYNDPDFGSIIQGGTDSEGTVYPGVIGSLNDSSPEATVKAEIQRICHNYQIDQTQRNQDDLSTYGSSTLSVGEALLSVSDIQVQQIETMMYVSVSIDTGSGPATITSGIGS